MISKIRGMIKFTDMFYSSEMLRHEDDQQYRTVTGGLLSITIIITTLIGFASMILDTLSLSSITTTTQVTKSNDPTYSTFTTSPEYNFMFGVELWPHVTGSQRYFQVAFARQISFGQSYTTQRLSLQPCTREHWSMLPNSDAVYDSLNIAKWLCPPIGQVLQIYGKYSSNSTSAYVLSVTKCNDSAIPTQTCASQAEIDDLFVSVQQRMFFTLYMTNPIINPDQKDYKSYFLEEQNYVTFGSSLGSHQAIYFSDYTINTDESIWPFQRIVSDEGIIMEGAPVKHPYQNTINGTYARIQLAKSPNSITYTRKVQKISSVFSFIGGMISAASTALFFIKIYTNLSYQISIAKSIFKYEKEKESSIGTLGMDFITFISYYFYHICKKVGFKLQWPRINYISECQEEIAKQLDIKLIIKRFIFIEHCLTNIFQDFQLGLLQEKNPKSVQQIRSIRQKCQCLVQEKTQQKQQPCEKVSNTNKIHCDIQSQNIEVPQIEKKINAAIQQIRSQQTSQQHLPKIVQNLNENRLSISNFIDSNNVSRDSNESLFGKNHFILNFNSAQSINIPNIKIWGSRKNQSRISSNQDTNNRLIIPKIKRTQSNQ